MTDDHQIPAPLLRGLSDSDVEVISWGADTGELVLRVIKDIGPEVGLLRFRGVGHVNLVPRMAIEGMEIGGLESLPAGYLATSGDDWGPGAGERVFLFRESWGAEYLVIAASASYEVLTATSASGDSVTRVDSQPA